MKINLPSPISVPEKIKAPKGEASDYITQIKSEIEKSVEDIKKVSEISTQIMAQEGWESFWNKSKNISSLANNVSTISIVQQRTLDMIILLMGAASRMKKDYNIIMESIDEMAQAHSGKIEVLDHLVKIKKTIKKIRERDELLESLITYSNDLRSCIKDIDEKNSTFLNDITVQQSILLSQQTVLNSKLEEIAKVQNGLSIDHEMRFESMDSKIRQALSDSIGLRKRFRVTWIWLAIFSVFILTLFYLQYPFFIF